MKKKNYVRKKRFEALLRSRNVTAYKLAKKLGYKDTSSVYKWIYGRGEPKAATMLKLMEILDVSAVGLLACFAEGDV